MFVCLGCFFPNYSASIVIQFFILSFWLLVHCLLIYQAWTVYISTDKMLWRGVKHIYKHNTNICKGIVFATNSFTMCFQVRFQFVCFQSSICQKVPIMVLCLTVFQCPNMNMKSSYLLTCPVNLLIRLVVRQYFQLLVNFASLKHVV